MSAESGLAPIRSVFIVSGGNFLEMYDFMVYGYYAGAIAKVYFPSGDPYASTMAAFAAFGAGFLMRPVGAIVLGAFIDRRGRRVGLLLTLGLMAVGTLTIAATPAYARIGLAAPLLVLSGRLIQGLSAGVELGGVSVYLAEIAKPSNRGFMVSWQSASQQVAVVFAAVIGLIAGAWLNRADMIAWGWRIPFVIGCALIPFVFVIRGRLRETPAFLARAEQPAVADILASVVRNGAVVGLGAMMATLTTVAFYMITAYTPTYGSGVLRLSLTSAFTVTLCVGASNLVLLPLAGAASDRIGRLPLLVGAGLVILFTSYPALRWLSAGPSLPRLLAVELWLSAAYAAYNGAMVVFLTEAMPRAVRTTSFSLAYSLATALFGGFTPLVCTWLIHATNDKAAPGLWLSAAALVGLAGALGLGARAGRRAPRAEAPDLP
jgi:MFS family permease